VEAIWVLAYITITNNIADTVDMDSLLVQTVSPFLLNSYNIITYIVIVTIFII